MHNRAIEIIKNEVFPVTQPDEAHNLDHALIVMEHSINCLHDLGLDDDIKEDIIISSLLHDLDDHKVIRERWEENYWCKYVLNKIDYPRQQNILDMISLVSCSKWDDRTDSNFPDYYYYIPRYCDRLEAIGEIGIQRCIIYGRSLNRPMHASDTIRVNNKEELYKVATKERYNLYTSRRKHVYSDTTIDHCYDKLLHIRLPEFMSHITYLRDKFEERSSYIEDYVLNYWKGREPTAP